MRLGPTFTCVCWNDLHDYLVAMNADMIATWPGALHPLENWDEDGEKFINRLHQDVMGQAGVALRTSLPDVAPASAGDTGDQLPEIDVPDDLLSLLGDLSDVPADDDDDDESLVRPALPTGDRPTPGASPPLGQDEDATPNPLEENSVLTDLLDDLAAKDSADTVSLTGDCPWSTFGLQHDPWISTTGAELRALVASATPPKADPPMTMASATLPNVVPPMTTASLIAETFTKWGTSTLDPWPLSEQPDQALKLWDNTVGATKTRGAREHARSLLEAVLNGDPTPPRKRQRARHRFLARNQDFTSLSPSRASSQCAEARTAKRSRLFK